MKKISVVIHTYNSEKFMRQCLEGVKDFDEILICDMYSTDATLDIAKEYGARIIFHENVGFADPARNYAIHSAENEWVFVVDSDEIVRPRLKEYIYDFVNSEKSEEYAGLEIPFASFYLGRFLHGDYPNFHLRLMRKSKAYWPPTVHTQATVDGKVYRVKRPRFRKGLAMLHLGNESIDVKLRKFKTYSDNELIRRKGQKFSLFSAWLKCFYRFFRSYIMKCGFLDGKAGYAHARISSMYKFVTMAKLWEAEYDKKLKEQEQKK